MSARVAIYFPNLIYIPSGDSSSDVNLQDVDHLSCWLGSLQLTTILQRLYKYLIPHLPSPISPHCHLESLIYYNNYYKYKLYIIIIYIYF